jgi:hypothetical protein
MTVDAWLQGLKADLQWMHAINPTALPADWSLDMTALFDLWQSHTYPWKSLVKAVSRKHMMQEMIMAEAHAMHREIFAVLQEGGVIISPDPFHAGRVMGEHKCFCGDCFPTARDSLRTSGRSIKFSQLKGSFFREQFAFTVGSTAGPHRDSSSI